MTLKFLILWLKTKYGLTYERSLICIMLFNIIFAGISLRIGGQLTKGPYLPETLDGISKTTKAVLGKE